MKVFPWTFQHLFVFLIFTIVLAGMLLFSPTAALAHGGRLNKCGCHKVHRYDPPKCHCHRAPYGGCGRECYAAKSEAEQASAPAQCCIADDRGDNTQAAPKNKTGVWRKKSVRRSKNVILPSPVQRTLAQ